MTVTDPIADMLTRIRNGIGARKHFVEVPSSGLKLQLAKILKEEGYIQNFVVNESGPQGTLKIQLKYTSDNEPVIQGIVRLSKPGRRVYKGKGALPRVLGGLGISIVTTSKGVMTSDQARQAGVGGELLCAVW